MNKTRVQITQQHIDSGIRRSGIDCAAGKACNEAFGVAVYAGYGITEVYEGQVVDCNRPYKLYQNGPLLTTWIVKFDHTEQVDPVTIEFDHDEFTVEVV